MFKKFAISVGIAVSLVLFGVVSAFTGLVVQRRDLASTLNGVVSLAPAPRSNTAATGTIVDLANYSGAMIMVAQGQADNVATLPYVVLFDSIAGSAAAAVDSIQLDTVDNSYKEIGYKGSKRFIRALQRASGGAADTFATSATIVRGGCRVQPC